MIRALAALVIFSGAAAAQGIVSEPLDPIDPLAEMEPADDGVSLQREFAPRIELEASVETQTGAGAMLRGLDKLDGNVEDLELANGGEAVFGELQISLSECRYPEDNPAGEGFAHLTIYDGLQQKEVFSGWMVASSPALNALDHARYDVWVLGCKTS